jgi:hypothetical protein
VPVTRDITVVRTVISLRSASDKELGLFTKLALIYRGVL